MSEFTHQRNNNAEEEEVEVEEDIFWSLMDSAHHHCDDSDCDSEGRVTSSRSETTPSLPHSTYTYTPKNFSLSAKESPIGDTLPHTSSPVGTSDGGMRVYLGESKESGCMSDIGGVMWEASVLLGCFLLSNLDVFVSSSVLELGAGVGVPGLLLTALKVKQLELEKKCDNRYSGTNASTSSSISTSTNSCSSTLSGGVGSVCFTDYDSDVLDNMVKNIYNQFQSNCDIQFHHQHDPVSPAIQEDSVRKVHVSVKRLDWTDDIYGENINGTKVTQKSNCTDVIDSNFDIKSVEVSHPNLLIGSELVYMSSLASLATVILRFLEGGTREIVIVQMPSRSGFNEFMALLSAYKDEGKLDFALDSVSDKLYEAARQVTYAHDGSYLLFPEESVDEVLSNTAPSTYRASAYHQGESRPVLTTKKDDFAVLRIWKSCGSSIFPFDSCYEFPGDVENSLSDKMKEDVLAHFVPRTCRVATFNVNARNKNCGHFLEFLRKLDLDVICLQECPYELAEKLKRGLGAAYESVYAYAEYCGNALLTRLTVVRSWTVELYAKKSYEMRSAAMAMLSLDLMSEDGTNKKTIEFCVCATHLCHLSENARLEQLEQLLTEIESPCMLLGDLNSLYEADYTPQKWHQITEIRKRCQLTPAASRVISHLLEDLSYRDCRTLFSLENAAVMEHDDFKTTITNPAPTSSYDTRVDWILVPPLEVCRRQRIPFHVTVAAANDYIVVPSISSKLSDHNLVMSNLRFDAC